MTSLIRRLTPLWLALIAGTASFIGHYGLFVNRLNMYDDGYWAEAGLRILEGQRPYRDFHFAYGPLQSFIHALFLRIAEHGYFGYRVSSLAILSLTVAITALAARLALGGILWPLMAAFFLASFGQSDPRTLLLSVAMLGFLGFLRFRRQRLLLLAGAAAGACGFAGLELGAVLLVATILTFASTVPERGKDLVRETCRTCWAYLAGFLGVSAILLVFITSWGALPAWGEQVLLQPRRLLAHGNLPFPWFWNVLDLSRLDSPTLWRDLIPNLEVFGPLAVVTYIGIRWIQSLVTGPAFRSVALDPRVVFLALVSLGISPVVLNRCDSEHAAYCALPNCLLFVVVSRIAPLPVLETIRPTFPLLRIRTTIALGFVLAHTFWAFAWRVREFEHSRTVYFSWQGRSYFAAFYDEPAPQLLTYIQNTVTPRGKFVTAFDPTLYTLAGQRCPVFLSQIVRGYVTPESERRIIQEIRGDPSIVAFVTRGATQWRPTNDLLADYAPNLEDFLRATFSSRQTVGPYEVFLRTSR